MAQGIYDGGSAVGVFPIRYRDIIPTAARGVGIAGGDHEQDVFARNTGQKGAQFGMKQPSVKGGVLAPDSGRAQKAGFAGLVEVAVHRKPKQEPIVGTVATAGRLGQLLFDLLFVFVEQHGSLKAVVLIQNIGDLPAFGLGVGQ